MQRDMIMTTVAYGVMAVVIGVVLGSLVTLRCCSGRVTSIERDTVRTVERDTVWRVRTIREPYAVYVEPSDTIKVVPDVSSGVWSGSGDTLLLERVQKRYDDSLATVWVSGYAVSVDSMTIRERMARVTESVNVVERSMLEVPAKNNRWQVGVIGGYGIGLSTGRMEPFLGIGIGYRLFPR